jgi:DNA-binding GntR family transcriptional regulator
MMEPKEGQSMQIISNGVNTLTPIEPVSLGDRTAERIKTAIIAGELAPGSALRDRQLADQLGVSRTPVRDALHRLEATGLVVARGRSGWAVSPFTEQDVREMFQLRRLFEPVALQELSERPERQTIAELGGFFDKYHSPIQASLYPEYFAHDHAFHKRIVACSANRRLREMYSVMEYQIDRGRHFLTTAAKGRADETLDEHLSIVHAILAMDFELAQRELISHLKAGEELMLEQLRQRSS